MIAKGYSAAHLQRGDTRAPLAQNLRRHLRRRLCLGGASGPARARSPRRAGDGIRPDRIPGQPRADELARDRPLGRGRTPIRAAPAGMGAAAGAADRGMGDRIAHADPSPPDPACATSGWWPSCGRRARTAKTGSPPPVRRSHIPTATSTSGSRGPPHAPASAPAPACPPAPADATALGWPRVGIYGPDSGLRFRVEGLARDAVGPPLAPPRDHRVRLRPAPGAPLELNGQLSDGETPRRSD